MIENLVKYMLRIVIPLLVLSSCKQKMNMDFAYPPEKDSSVSEPIRDPRSGFWSCTVTYGRMKESEILSWYESRGYVTHQVNNLTYEGANKSGVGYVLSRNEVPVKLKITYFPDD